MVASNAPMWPFGLDAAAGVDLAVVAGHKGTLGVAVEIPRADLDGIREQSVVGIEEDQELAATLSKAGVPCAADNPAFACWTRRTESYRAATCEVSSVDPSSTTITSIGR